MSQKSNEWEKFIEKQTFRAVGRSYRAKISSKAHISACRVAFLSRTGSFCPDARIVVSL